VLTKDNRLTNVPGAGRRSLLDSDTWAVMMRFAEHKRRFAAGMARVGLHQGQEFMLAHLWREEGLTQSQLADRLCTSAPNVAQVVRGLERAGLVVRRRDDPDGRVVRVYLTAAGRDLEAETTAAWYEVEDELAAGMSPAERSAYRTLGNR
jgi:MarR family transcriptional regulator, organic hydroperoxide resistance regulator